MNMFLLYPYDQEYLVAIVALFYALMCICVRFMQLYVFSKVYLMETFMWNRDEIEDKLKHRLNSSTMLSDL